MKPLFHAKTNRNLNGRFDPHPARKIQETVAELEELNYGAVWRRIQLCALTVSSVLPFILIDSVHNLDGALNALAKILVLFTSSPGFQVATLAQNNVTTYHYNNARTGLNANETILTPANVNPAHFGRLFSQKVDGNIYAQPLYLAKLAIPDKGVHNVVFVVTEGDSVYAFDADDNRGANANPLWHANLLDAAHGAPPGATTADMLKELHCTAIVPQVGITSTPVIDPITGTIFVDAYSKEGGSFVHRLHALDVATGNEKSSGPVMVTATVPGTGEDSMDGKLSFDASHELNRPGLLLQNGILYIGFSSHCDRQPAHGWLLAYDALTMMLKSAFVTTPDGQHGGIWMSGAGLAADESGDVFVATGNGTYDFDHVPAHDLSQSILKINWRDGQLAVVDYFTPFNERRLNFRDRDLGSGGVTLLPDQPGEHPHLLIQTGKEARIYLIDRDQMTANDLHFCSQHCTSDPEIVQEIPNAFNGMFYGTPTYWNNYVYFLAPEDVLKAFDVKDGKLSAAPASVAKDRYGYPGANLSVSANGNRDGIIWALESDGFNTNNSAVLKAYDASDVSHKLYSSATYAKRDNPGGVVKFAVPTVVNGKVYVGAAQQLSVFGLFAKGTKAGSGPHPSKVQH